RGGPGGDAGLHGVRSARRSRRGARWRARPRRAPAGHERPRGDHVRLRRRSTHTAHRHVLHQRFHAGHPHSSACDRCPPRPGGGTRVLPGPRMTRAKIGVAIVTVGLVLYFWFTLQRAWIMVTDDSLVAKGIGIALFALPLIGAWTLVRELLFGAQTQRLAQILADEGGLPPDNLPRTPGGRIVRAAAD